MQVATLFRESTSLLGANMETGGIVGGGGGGSGGSGSAGGSVGGAGGNDGNGSGGGGSGGGGNISNIGIPGSEGGPAGATPAGDADTPDSASSGLETGPIPYDSHYNHPLSNKYKLAITKQEFEPGLWPPYENHYTYPLANKYKLNMKLEPHDDGYETSADLLLSNSTTPGREPKCEKLEDPYSFIDDDPMPMIPIPQGPPTFLQNSPPLGQIVLGPKKRGRKKKIKTDDLDSNSGMNGSLSRPIKERKKHDRFNGMPEEEVSKRTLPDHLAANLDIIIIGINPGLFAAYKGHHYAGPGNHFWKCLYLSGLTEEQMTADEDYKLLQSGIGFTNMVQRPTKGSADLTRKEIKEGSQILLEKLRKFRPKIAVFNGKLIYEVFSGKKDFHFGRQPDCVDGTNTYIWVMPSSSARCAQLPRAADKVPFYAALKKFKDYLNGQVQSIDESEMVFTEPRLKACYEPEPKPDPDLMDISNAVIKNEDGTIVPCKKKRGRPKKIKVEGEEPPKPTPRKPPNQTNCDFPKKKRGRPKKVKVEENENPTISIDTSTSMNKCFSTPSPIHSPVNYYHMPPDVTPPNGSGTLYGPQPTPVAYNQSPKPHSYTQSPRPHSQPFTHSDLSSEISAAISSEQLGSPASPSLGPPDFEPPTNMAEEPECRFSSPASSTPSDPAHFPYQSSYGIEPNENYAPPRQPQDIASKSLSGLESLVDQIPSIADGETLSEPADFAGQYMNNFNAQARSSPAPYTYPTTSGYPLYPTPTWSAGPYEPVPLAYPQLPYAQGYAPGLHVPGHNYPYYSYPQPAPAHPPGYPPYLGGF